MKLKLKKTILETGLDKAKFDLDFTELEIGKAFGKSLKALRKKKGFTLDELSKAVDIPNPTINRYENGINIPTITQALKLADFFEVTIEEMVARGIAE